MKQKQKASHDKGELQKALAILGDIEESGEDTDRWS
jgi:hypothetical protein